MAVDVAGPEHGSGAKTEPGWEQPRVRMGSVVWNFNLRLWEKALPDLGVSVCPLTALGILPGALMAEHPSVVFV